jgi:hypothetical protein
MKQGEADKNRQVYSGRCTFPECSGIQLLLSGNFIRNPTGAILSAIEMLRQLSPVRILGCVRLSGASRCNEAAQRRPEIVAPIAVAATLHDVSVQLAESLQR